MPLRTRIGGLPVELNRRIRPGWNNAEDYVTWTEDEAGELYGLGVVDSVTPDDDPEAMSVLMVWRVNARLATMPLIIRPYSSYEVLATNDSRTVTIRELEARLNDLLGDWRNLR